MKNIITISILSTTLLIFTGCGMSEVTPLDRGVYLLQKSDARLGMGPPGVETVTAVYKKANNFCKGKNKEVQRINNIYTDSGFGKTANFALEFRCVKYGSAVKIDKNNKLTASTSDRLKGLKKMLDDGLISEDEFNVKKAKIIENY